MGRILYHLVAPLDVVVGPDEPSRRQAFLAAHAAPGTEVEVRTPAQGRDSVEGAWDAVTVGPHIVDGLIAGQADGFDAAIIGCFSDPAIDAAKEAVNIPVVGAGAAAIHLALQLGDRIGIVSPGPGDPGRSRAMVRAMGLETHFATARGMGLSVSDLARAEEDALARIEATARDCVAEGADVLLLGCMSMAFLDPTHTLTERLGVPVVNPVIAALKTAETMIGHRLTQSRVRWPRADAKPILHTAAIHR